MLQLSACCKCAQTNAQGKGLLSRLGVLVLLFFAKSIMAGSTEFIETSCGTSLSLSGSVVAQVMNWSHLPSTPGPPCVIKYSAFSHYHTSQASQRLQVTLLTMSIPGSLPQCECGHLDVLDSDGSTPLSQPHGMCGEERGKIYDTSGSQAFLRITSKNSTAKGHVKMLVTAYNTYECDSNKEFCCNNGRCVETALTCDGYNNCGDNSDEESGCLLSTPIIATIIACSLVLVVAMVVISVVAIRRNWTSGWGKGATLMPSINDEDSSVIIRTDLHHDTSYGSLETKS